MDEFTTCYICLDFDFDFDFVSFYLYRALPIIFRYVNIPSRRCLSFCLDW